MYTFFRWRLEVNRSSASPFLQLRDIWIRQIVEGGPHEQDVDVSVWLARATLDVIGLAGKLEDRLLYALNLRRDARAGFGYELNTLANGETNELVRAFMDLFSPNKIGSAIGYLAHWVPLLRWIVRISQSHRSITQAETPSN